MHAECTTGFVAVPVVTSISVNLVGDVTICWLPVADVDGIASYSIYTINPNTLANVFVDNVLVGTNCYTILAANNSSDTQVIELGVVANDVCANPSAVGANYTNTILLEDTFNVCNSSVPLEWNAYDFNPGADIFYNIYVQINNGGYNLFGSTKSLDTIYSGIIQGDIYEFYIDAIYENTGIGPYSSTSNAVLTNTTDAIIPPAYNYLYTVNVLDSTQVSLQFKVDVAADVKSYRIKRSTSLNGSYITVGSVNSSSNASPVFTDNNGINANENSYYYKVFPVNDCEVEGDPYNFGRTILVTAVSNPLDATNTVTITPYEGWENGVKEYELLRSVAGVWESNPVAVFSGFSGGSFVYEDDITTAFYGDGEFCYKIEATENAGFHRDNPAIAAVPAKSLSNEACVLHEPLLYIPSAFIPNSEYNNEYKPVLTFVEPESYFFQIYNKWGEVIFETQDFNEAWNGTLNNSGGDCQQDIYIYLIEFVSAEGDEYSKRGKVTLLR